MKGITSWKSRKMESHYQSFCFNQTHRAKLKWFSPIQISFSEDMYKKHIIISRRNFRTIKNQILQQVQFYNDSLIFEFRTKGSDPGCQFLAVTFMCPLNCIFILTRVMVMVQYRSPGCEHHIASRCEFFFDPKKI